MKKIEKCVVCAGEMDNIASKIQNVIPSTGRITNPIMVDYAICKVCEAYEEGRRPGGNNNIHRIGFFVVTASGEIALGDGPLQKIIEETKGLLDDQRYRPYLDMVKENPYDNAIGAILLDWIEDNDPEFATKYPRSHDALVRRRLKVTGKWDTRQPSPIL